MRPGTGGTDLDIDATFGDSRDNLVGLEWCDFASAPGTNGAPLSQGKSSESESL